jgi:small-conductance mechanosensitive channel
VGDFISVNGVTGTVTMIGMKSTRIRSLSGEQVVMSNTSMLKQTINNFRYLQERRIVFKFGVTYAATPEQLEEIPKLVKGIIDAEKNARFDRGHFARFGENALEFEVVYIVLDPAYGVYMDLQQKINLTLMRKLRDMGVGFSLPGRMLYMAPGSMPAAMNRNHPNEGPMQVNAPGVEADGRHPDGEVQPHMQEQARGTSPSNNASPPAPPPTQT